MTDLLTSDDAGVRTLTLNRPDALNAMSDDLFDDLRRGIVSSASDPAVKCVVLAGAGRAFCAGVDLKTLEAGRRWNDGEPHGFIPCIEEIERFPKPLIAAVNGAAIGFGTTVLLHCDLVIASTEARFRLPFVHLGLSPEAGSSYLLPDRIGHQDAAHMLFTGRWVTPQEALDLGIVWRLVEPGELADSAAGVAREIATAPVQALIATKKNLIATKIEAVRTARARELDSYARLLVGEAHLEAVVAFRAGKRT